jgi:hypothetical protein
MSDNETSKIGDVSVTMVIERHTMLGVGDFLPTATDPAAQRRTPRYCRRIGPLPTGDPLTPLFPTPRQLLRPNVIRLDGSYRLSAWSSS